MNGFSLLLVLAAVGVEFGWEQTSGNKLVYTIRIEPVLLEQLRDGAAIESVVDQNDRGLRKFRIAMGPKTSQNDRAASTTANEVAYGWRPNSDGGLDYYVQITPERLETLNKGIPLDCEVHPDVPEMQRIYVFVGTSQLPRENLPTQQPAAVSPSQQFAAATNTQPAANNSNVATTGGTDSRVSTPRYSDSGFRSDAGTQSTAAANAAGSKSFNQTSPAATDRWTQAPPTLSNNGSSGTQLTRDYGTNGTNNTTVSTNAGQTLPVPDLHRNTNSTATYGNDLYGGNRYLNDPYATRTDLAQQAASAATAFQNPAHQLPQNYSPPLGQQTLTAQQLAQQQFLAQQQQQLLTQPQAALYPTQATATGWNAGLPVAAALQPAAAQQPAAAPATTALAQTPPATEKEKESAEVKPWTPLILTTLGLFASIAANAYLGWLAWSFFWRYRDSASDLARARTAATSVRQAA